MGTWCVNINWTMKILEIDFDPTLNDSSKPGLKAVLLHNENVITFVLVVNVADMK